MFYKNVSCYKKTFHGVDFGPGEVKEVSEFINDKSMILVKAVPSKEKKQPSEVSAIKEEPKKEEKKEEAKKPSEDVKKPSEKAENTSK